MFFITYITYEPNANFIRNIYKGTHCDALLEKKTGMNHHGATESILCNSEATHTDLKPQFCFEYSTQDGYDMYIYIYICTTYCNSQHEHNLDSSVATLVYHLVWNSQKDISSFLFPIF